MTTVAEQFAATLAAAGVKRIYGIVGDSLNGLTDAIRTPGQDRVGPCAARGGRGVRGWGRGAPDGLSSPSAPEAAGPATCTSSTACSTAIARACRCLPSRRTSRRPRSAPGYFQETHPEILFQECSHYCELVSGAKSDAAHARGRDPRSGRQARRVGRGDSRRRCPAAGRRCAAAQARGPAAAAAGDDAGAIGSRPPGDAAQWRRAA